MTTKSIGLKLISVYFLAGIVGGLMYAFTFDHPRAGGQATWFFRTAMIAPLLLAFLAAMLLERTGSMLGPIAIMVLNALAMFFACRLLDARNGGSFAPPIT
jgi:hypothetical protein